jgi:putative alpha-1,2-mannosidase
MVKEYHATTDGLVGNDDAGQMSAWYVISALGFYAVTPGTPQYAIGTPHFDVVIVSRANGKTLRIHAPGAERGKFYVRTVLFNGKQIDRTYLLHSEIVGGGDFNFEMSYTPGL